MIRTIPFAAAALVALVGLTATPASAQIAVISQGENFVAERADGDTGNIVGGGLVEVLGQGENVRIRHRDPAFAERAPGIPVAVGGSRGDIVYLPPRQASSLAALMGGTAPG